MLRIVESKVTKVSSAASKAFGPVLNLRGVAILATVAGSYVATLLVVIHAYRKAYAITWEGQTYTRFTADRELG